LIIPVVLEQQRDEVIHAAQIFTVFIPVNILHLNLIAILNGLHDFAWFHAMRFLAYLLVAAMLVALAIADTLTVQSASLTYVVANLGVGCLSTGRIIRFGAIRLRYDSNLLKSLVAYGVRAQSSSAATVLNERLDQLVMSAVLSPRQLGLYVVAATFTAATVSIGTAVGLVMLPVVARVRAAVEQGRQIARLSALAFCVSALISIVIALAVPVLIELFFGHRFDGATDSARVLLTAAVFLGTNRALSAALKGINRPLGAGLAELLALAVTVVGLAVFLPPLGIIGAALASLVAYMASFGVMLILIRGALDVPGRSLLIPDRAAFQELGTAARKLMTDLHLAASRRST
jgi:O-antigen/teichoic acid export membrane protein